MSVCCLLSAVWCLLSGVRVRVRVRVVEFWWNFGEILVGGVRVGWWVGVYIYTHPLPEKNPILNY